jgi:hypothetical protein
VYQFTTAHNVEYEVRFGRKKENILHSIVVFGVLNDDYDGEEYIVTNKGDVFRVMTTIAEVIKMYLNHHPNMQIVEFTGILRAEDEIEQMSQRTKLYLRFLPRVFNHADWTIEISVNKIIAQRIKR